MSYFWSVLQHTCISTFYAKNDYCCLTLLHERGARHARKPPRLFRFTSCLLRPTSQSITRGALWHTRQSGVRNLHLAFMNFSHNSGRWGTLRQPSLAGAAGLHVPSELSPHPPSIRGWLSRRHTTRRPAVHVQCTEHKQTRPHTGLRAAKNKTHWQVFQEGETNRVPFKKTERFGHLSRLYWTALSSVKKKKKKVVA